VQVCIPGRGAPCTYGQARRWGPRLLPAAPVCDTARGARHAPPDRSSPMLRTPLTLTLLALDRDARADLLAAIAGMVPAPEEESQTLVEVIDLGADARPAVGELDGWTILVDTLFAVPDQAEVVHRATRGRNG